MGGSVLAGCIFFCFAVNVLSVYGSNREQRFQGYTKDVIDPSRVDDILEDQLKLLRLELKKLNITHQIPGICSVCKSVLGAVIKQIPENETKDHLTNILHGACKDVGVPGWICSQFVNNYHVRIVIDIINKHMRDPRKICLVLRLCWWPAPQNKHDMK